MSERSGLIQRTINLELVRAEGDDKSNIVECIASTDANYDWGYYREQLLHTKENVDVSPAKSVLMNHDRNQIIGGIKGTTIDGKQMRAELEIDPEVKMGNGMNVLRAIRNGYVRGISIGYDYSRADCTFTEDENGKQNVRVNRWQLREISITPTPADVAATVTRQLPEGWTGANAAHDKGVTAMAAENGSDKDELAKERAAKDEAVKTAETAKRELAAMQHAQKMDDLARSHGVQWKREEANGKSEAECATLMLERKSKVEAERINPTTQQGVIVTRDAADKADEAAEDGLRYLAGAKVSNKNLGMRSGSVLDMGRRWLIANGVRDAAMMDKQELAECLLGEGHRMSRHKRMRGQRDAANVTSGMFTSFLLANVMDKTVFEAFSANDNVITYDKWTKSRRVSDFKTFSGAALDAGNLVETTENTPFPELLKDEGGYSDALSMWGATVSLTFQALVNDDLGQFMAKLGQAGYIARRTIDKKVYATLEAATWTNRTTVGDLTDDTVSINRANMAGITGPAGEVLGLVPRYLIVPAGLRSKALTISQISASLIENDVIKVNTDLLPIITPYLTTATTASQSKWYLAVDTMLDPMIVATLAGIDAPIVEEYDAGAVAARKWKIMMPFKAVLPVVTAPSTTPRSMWQGKHS